MDVGEGTYLEEFISSVEVSEMLTYELRTWAPEMFICMMFVCIYVSMYVYIHMILLSEPI